MTARLPLLTNSSINTFRRCPREYYFRYVLLRKPRDRSEALRFGSFFHVGLNEWWRPVNSTAEVRLGCGLDAMRARARSSKEDADPFELVKAEELLLGYTARWGWGGYHTVGVEIQFRMPLNDAADLGGAIDAICMKDSVAHNVEHKTAGVDISPGGDYWRRVVALDPQISTYLAASKFLGINPKDTIYDVVRKPTLLPLKATPDDAKLYTKPTKSEPVPRLYASMRERDETAEEYGLRLREDITDKPAKYYQRMTVVRLERDDAEFHEDVIGTSYMIRYAESVGRWPRSPGACERYNQLCGYHAVCSGTAAIDDDTRFTAKTNQHEELGVS